MLRKPKAKDEQRITDITDLQSMYQLPNSPLKKWLRKKSVSWLGRRKYLILISYTQTQDTELEASIIYMHYLEFSEKFKNFQNRELFFWICLCGSVCACVHLSACKCVQVHM